ncbi:MAG TPA: ACT domain-containing protein, partial [Solirubrobacteraceae bacterium]|nr:ACT domain-containing protein [Solirubrobacteraceae bacterium]
MNTTAPDSPSPPPITRLLIACPDQPGIVAAASRFLTEAGANIVHSDQHTTDPRDGTFFMRMEFDLALDPGQRAELEQRFAREVG